LLQISETDRLGNDIKIIREPMMTPCETPIEIKPEPPIEPKGASEIKDGNRFFIGNMSFVSTKADIFNYFSRFGEIIDVCLPLGSPNLNKGYAFVEFAEGAYTTENLIGRHLISGTIVILESSDASKRRPAANNKISTLMISSLPETMAAISSADINDYFRQYGKILKIVTTKKHFAFVRFETLAAANRAIGAGESSRFYISHSNTNAIQLQATFFIAFAVKSSTSKSQCIRRSSISERQRVYKHRKWKRNN